MPPSSTTRPEHRARATREAREAGSEEAREGAMADDISPGLALAVAAGSVVSLSLTVFGAAYWAVHAYETGQLGRGWRWMRLQTLGGVTTLEQTLSYNCAICQYSLEAHEKVRKLSCDHVFHSGAGTEKCEGPIEKWLCEQRFTCPFCRETPRPVMPWAARPPPTAAPAPAATARAASTNALGEEEPLLPPEQ